MACPKYNEMDYDTDCQGDQEKPKIRSEAVRGFILEAVANEKVSPGGDVEQQQSKANRQTEITQDHVAENRPPKGVRLRSSASLESRNQVRKIPCRHGGETTVLDHCLSSRKFSLVNPPVQGCYLGLSREQREDLFVFIRVHSRLIVSEPEP
jgi:hypothetical protein